MRFMMLMIPKGYEQARPGTMPDPNSVAVMMKYNESFQTAGVLLPRDGLHPPSVGAARQLLRRQAEGDRRAVRRDQEVIGGYWMIQVKSKQEAIEWLRAARLSRTK